MLCINLASSSHARPNPGERPYPGNILPCTTQINRYFAQSHSMGTNRTIHPGDCYKYLYHSFRFQLTRTPSVVTAQLHKKGNTGESFCQARLASIPTRCYKVFQDPRTLLHTVTCETTVVLCTIRSAGLLYYVPGASRLRQNSGSSSWCTTRSETDGNPPRSTRGWISRAPGLWWEKPREGPSLEGKSESGTPQAA